MYTSRDNKCIALEGPGAIIYQIKFFLFTQPKTSIIKPNFPDKNTQLAGLRFFFHKSKKTNTKKNGIPVKTRGRPSLYVLYICKDLSVSSLMTM